MTTAVTSALCGPLNYKGRCVGAIRVYMAELHEFDWYERSMLQAVAAQAAAAIENARLDEEAERGAELQRALSMAAEVQRRMFPAEAPKATQSGARCADVGTASIEPGA